MQYKEHEIVKEFAELAYTMWSMGWDEKNGGNISYILSEKELEELDLKKKEFVTLSNIPQNLVGQYILITAAGSNFRLIKNSVEETTGIILLEQEGFSIMAGFENKNKPTSELYMHLLSHSTRLEIDPDHRAIVHNHATEISEMSFIHELDDKSFTRTLWGIITECIVVFPDGVGVLPWMVCGNEEIGKATAEKMKKSRIVIWAYHGILAAGNSLNDAFGLIETVNKAAKIYVNTVDKRITDGISDEELKSLCAFFDIQPRKEYLS